MTDNQERSAPGGGLGLRTKLTLGFVGLLAILLTVSVESISLLSDLGGSIDVILRENYKSVVACERMKEALERMDSGALFALAGELEEGRELTARNRPRFEEALQTELGNVTLAGEGEKAERIRQLFASYLPVLERILDPRVPAEGKHALYFESLLPVFQRIKSTADEILQMNQQNMVAANDRARSLAASANRRMALLLIAGTAFAGLCIFFLSRALLGPLERMTRAAKQIERGDLDLTVPVESRDELGQLAAAFNSMAGGLRSLRDSEQAHLLRAQRSSQLAIDTLPEAVVVFSADRRVELANRAAASLLGARPGGPVPERYGRWLLPLLDRTESGRLAEEAPGETPVQLSSDERERFVLPHATLLRDARDRPDGFIVVLEDTTDRRRGREVRASLIANAAHDLEKVLGPLRSALESLDEERLGPLTGPQKQRVAGARAEAERLGGISASLLAMSRLEERRQELRLEPVPPGDLVAAAVRDAEDLYQEQKVKLLATETEPETPRVLADREQAGRLLPALLRNALAHTPAGGSVTLRAEGWEGRVRFTVSDTGDGVEPEYREQIFEPLYQVPGTQDLGGVGLGLTMARDIVQAHGGEIRCEGGKGGGATFWFTLPAAMD